jgi:hypothetical protein
MHKMLHPMPNLKALHRRHAALRLALMVGGASLLLMSPPAARAQTNGLNGLIFFEAINLTDTTQGQDLWQYQYHFAGFDLQAGQGFSIFFDHALYRALQNPPPVVNADWDVLSVQPDLLLRQPGYYDALAARNGPSRVDPFVVNFVWLGAGSPGAQPFDIYNTSFQTVYSGMTVVVPEPGALALASLGLAALLFGRKFRSMKNRHGGLDVSKS